MTQTTLDESAVPDRLPVFVRTRLRGPAWLAVLLPLLPVLLLALIPDADTFADTSSTLRTLGLLAGLLGYVAFATTIVMGARIPAVERLFGALDRLYRFHRKLGETVAALLVSHLVLMVGSLAIIDGGTALSLFRPDQGWRVFAGVVAAAGFAVVITLTFAPRLGHETFVQVHRLLGLVFGVAALHALRVPAFVAELPLLRGHLAVVTVAGVGAWIYRSGLGRSMVRRHYYRVASVEPVHPLVNQVTLTPLEEPMDFSPGQLVFIGIDDEAVTRELHPFSITSPTTRSTSTTPPRTPSPRCSSTSCSPSPTSTRSCEWSPSGPTPSASCPRRTCAPPPGTSPARTSSCAVHRR